MIPVNTPRLNGNEKKYLEECISSGWISSEGPFVKKFEEAMANLVNQKFGVAVTNGTDALELAVRVLGVGEGDEIILPSFCIISCAQAIIQNGAKPVLVDVDPETWNMDTQQVAEKITSRTKAIMVVHTYGMPVDMDPIIDLANENDLFIIEDAAEAHGQTYHGDPCGGFGEVSIFSFYPNKHITTGEGGMVLTFDREIDEQLRYYRNLCFQPKRRFVHEDLGYNMRMTNLQAALGLAQTEQIEASIARKKAMGKRYQEAFADLDCFELPVKEKSYAENVYWVFGLVVKDNAPFTREEICNYLAEKAIGTRPFFWGMHEQPVFKKMGLFRKESYPVTERISRNGFYIPSGLGLSDEDQEKVIESIRGFVNG